MYILSHKWEDGYLDYHRPDNYVRIQVRAWQTILNITDKFVPQPRELRKVWNYIREVGLRVVIRKVIIRMREKLRDKKVLAIGVGTVVQSSAGSSFEKGASVVFIAPSHPPCTERVVLLPELITAIDQATFEKIAVKDGIRYIDEPANGEKYDELAGWTEYSGHELPDSVPALLKDAVARWGQYDRNTGAILPLSAPTDIREYTSARQGQSKLKAVVFGYGNLVKLNILSNLDPKIDVTCIHEIDPTQLGMVKSFTRQTDTSPAPRPNDNYDLYFIAGYHHTHVPHAVHALESGAWAIVEKPLVTTWDQYNTLMQAVERNPGKLFVGFQMRYSPLWQWAFEDLRVKEGDPIHYHCIVFEIPLPQRHWYNWPNSRSRIVSNGCHWIDHFLFMNNYSKPERYDLWKGHNEDMHISMELANGAVFGMCLTDHGSARIGVQEHIELRASGVTVKVDNATHYLSENNHQLLRKGRINKMSVINIMYQRIYEKILRGQSADSIDSIRMTSQAMLTLDDLYYAR